MPQRELRVVANDRVVGLVAVDDEGPRFEGAARQIFARIRADLGDEQAAQQLIAVGWSNGYLYLA